MLFPYSPDEYWERMRKLIREENVNAAKEQREFFSQETPGLTYKPLYKITEVCAIFSVSRTTIYEWIKEGKLKPFKVRSRLYFLHNDMQKLMEPDP